MTHFLTIAENEFDENTFMETKLTTADDFEDGYLVEVDFKDFDTIKQKQIKITLCPKLEQ